MSAPPYQLTVDGFAPDHFRVHSFTGKETISDAWSFDVVVTADAGDPIERSTLGQRAVLVFNVSEAQRAFYGIVGAVKLSQAHRGQQATKYQLRVLPRLWRLKKRQRSRIFQKMRVPDVITAVLQEAGIACCWQLTRAYPAREYCVQFEETDYAFVRRIAAEAGIYFYFPEGPVLDAAALVADAAIGAAAAGGGALLGAVGGQALGSLVGSAASLAQTLIPGDTVICGDDAACYPPLRGDDGAALAASTAAAMAPAIGDLVGAGDGIAGAVVGGASALAGTILAAVADGAGSVPGLHFLTSEEAAVQKQDKVTRFSLRNTVRSSAAVFRDYDPDRPMVRLESTAVSTQPFPPSAFDLTNAAAMAASAVAGAVGLPSGVGSAVATVGSAVGPVAGALGKGLPTEVYDHHGTFLFPKWGFAADEAPRILRQKRRRASIASGESGCSDLCPGHRFSLDDHPAQQLDGEYVVTEVEHHGETRPEDGKPFTVYWNAFECAPAVMTYVPSRPTRKSVQVSLTATVVGPAGEEIHVDEQARIRVQVHGDREGKYDEKSSCWIRVMQPLAGAAWGHQFIPRIGHEVVVAFEGGDPDKPMILGSFYNGTHPPPFALPADKTRSGIRTQTSPGGGGFNELSFEDKAGQEQVYVHAQRNLDEKVERNHTMLVRNDEFLRVIRDRIDTIERHLVQTVRGDHSSQVEGNRLDVVKGNVDERVSGMRTIRVEGKDCLAVTGATDLTYADDVTTRVAGCVTTIVGKHDKQRSWATHAEGAAKLSSLVSTEVSSEGELVLRVGKSSIRISSDKVEIDAPTVTVKGKGGGLSASDDGLRLSSKGDAQLLVDKQLVLKTKGGASLSMDKEVKVDGSQILLNSPAEAKDPPHKAPDPPTKIELKDQDGSALAYQRFLVKLDGGTEVSGLTDKEGGAELDLRSSGKVTFPDTNSQEKKSGTVKPYVVRPGDYLKKLSHALGFDADGAWDHPKNADMKKQRDPNLLHPGDVLYVPDRAPKWEALIKGKTNAYVATVPRTKVHLSFRELNKPRASERYVIHGMGEPKEGTTDGEGALEVEVPVHVREIQVTFPKAYVTYAVRIGDMDPVDEPSGVRKRLQHLGFYEQAPDADLEAADARGLVAFQRARGLPETGVLDDTTKTRLIADHGS